MTPVALAVCGTISVSALAQHEREELVKAVHAYRAKGEAVEPSPDGTIFCEAEESQVEGSRTGGWETRIWGENYYAATFANTFLSRQACLSAPESCEESKASINVNVKQAGRYLVLVRYEAPYRFEAAFRVQIDQGGKTVMDRVYGARNNLKIWAFGKKIQKEVCWDWGAVENIVWEGHDAAVDLQPGPATLRLVAGPQTGDAAKRNVDIVMLTTDVEQVKTRIEKEAYLPLDGWLTQAGDVWIRARNAGAAPVTVKVSPCRDHSPYWVHMRTWKAVSVEVPPGKTTEWIDVGGTLDSLNDSQTGFDATGECTVEWGVRNAKGVIEGVGSFSGSGKVNLTAAGDMRYSRRIRKIDDLLFDLLRYVKGLPSQGRTPVLTPVYGYTFEAVPSAGPQYAAALREFKALYAFTDTEAKDPESNRAYIDVRGKTPAQLEEYCSKLTADQKRRVAVVSLGDEIGLPRPDAQSATEGFMAYLKSQGLNAEQVDPSTGGDWSKLVYNADPTTRAAKPGLYYWSMRYNYRHGILKMKELTDTLRKHLPNAGIGANFSPHHGAPPHAYLGEVFKWVSCFREEGMTLPWSEDYIWQLPVGTPQMNSIGLDLFRAGIRGKPTFRIYQYVMAHTPGNTPAMWRRLFYATLAHGAKDICLYEFRPVGASYTENYVNSYDMYAAVLLGLRELGTFEDIVQSGQVRPAQAGLWFSETADIWSDADGSFGAAKRALYIAVRQQQIPLDVLVEADALNGTLGQYKTLYLADSHVSRAASEAIDGWTRGGGRLFATAGAGWFDEYNQPNAKLRALLGVEPCGLQAPEECQVGYIKQDLPFARPLDEARWTPSPVTTNSPARTFPVFAVVAPVKAASSDVRATFRDGSPAVVERQVDKGRTTYCAFLPGLSFFRPAIPRRPVDRASVDEGMDHFLPTDFDTAVGDLVASAAVGVVRPVTVDAACVESTVLEGKGGIVIPLINWSGKPVKNAQVVVRAPVPAKAETATGGKIVATPHTDGMMYTLDIDVADALILR